jgi:hypothetical protein
MELAKDGIFVSVIFPSGMITRHFETSDAAQPQHLRRAIATEDDFVAMASSNPAMTTAIAAPEDTPEASWTRYSQESATSSLMATS